MNCPFCDLLADQSPRIIHETRHLFVVLDQKPVNPGHALIISKRHAEDAFGLNSEEWGDFPAVLA